MLLYLQSTHISCVTCLLFMNSSWQSPTLSCNDISFLKIYFMLVYSGQIQQLNFKYQDVTKFLWQFQILHSGLTKTSWQISWLKPSFWYFEVLSSSNSRIKWNLKSYSSCPTFSHQISSIILTSHIATATTAGYRPLARSATFARP